MPKPTKSLPDDVAILYHASSGTAPFENQPAIKIAIGEIFMAWGGLEYSQLRLFIALMGSRQKLAADIFFRLNTRGTKSDATAAIASYRLSKKELAIFIALDAAVKTAAKERDKLAHWIYGTLVFHGEEHARVNRHFRDTFALADPRTMAKPDSPVRTGYLYTVKELGDLRDRISKLAHHLGWMALVVEDDDARKRRERFETISRELGVRASPSRLGKALSSGSK